MLTVIKPVVEKALQPVGRLLKGVDPNLISLLGLIFPVLFFACVLQGWYLLALVAFIFLAVDLLDGMVARYANKVTPFGSLLDSTIDRFADFTVIAVFGFAGIVRWNIVLPLLLASFMISYIRSRIELASDKKISGAVGLVERTERMLTVFVGLLLYAIFPHAQWGGFNIAELLFLALTLASIYTVGQRAAFAYKKL